MRTTIDRYRIETQIGSGGMGVVYRGTHSWTGRPVAIKVLHPLLPSGAPHRKRFLREARAAASLRHPNVVDVLHMDQDDQERVYLVMELLSGEPLSALLARRGSLALSETRAHVLPVMDAVTYAHRKRIVHRDIKPDNIFLADTQAGTVPKLLDFGLAKLIDEGAVSVTDPGQIIGTPRYMAPERFGDDATITAAADVWALGVVLYECLAGRHPFGKSLSLPAMLLKVTTAEAPPIAQSCPDLPPTVAAAVDRALQRDPADRWPSVDAFAHALSAEATTYNRDRTRGRHRTLLAAGLLGSLAAGAWTQLPQEAQHPFAGGDPIPSGGSPRSAVSRPGARSAVSRPGAPLAKASATALSETGLAPASSRGVDSDIASAIDPDPPSVSGRSALAASSPRSKDASVSGGPGSREGTVSVQPGPRLALERAVGIAARRSGSHVTPASAGSATLRTRPDERGPGAPIDSGKGSVTSWPAAARVRGPRPKRVAREGTRAGDRPSGPAAAASGALDPMAPTSNDAPKAAKHRADPLAPPAPEASRGDELPPDLDPVF